MAAMSKLSTQLKKDKLVGSPRKRFVADRPFTGDMLKKTRKKYALKGPIKPKLTLDMTDDPNKLLIKLNKFIRFEAAAVVAESLEAFDLESRAKGSSSERGYDGSSYRHWYRFSDDSSLMVEASATPAEFAEELIRLARHSREGSVASRVG